MIYWIIVIILFLMWLFKPPKCPVCGAHSWDKNHPGDYWCCRWCGTWYDPIEKHWKRN